MKPILYSADETVFDTNGIGILSDAVDCTVIEIMNSQFELELKYPVKGIHYSRIQYRAIIMAKPNPVADLQPFRIYRITKPMNGIVTVYARHRAYDLSGITVTPFSATSVASAMSGMKSHAVTDCPFTFWTDKSTSSIMTVKVPMQIWTLLGGSRGSLLDIYGGEYEFDNDIVRLWNHRGTDRGVSIRYGKNLTDLEQDENCANCYTGVHPYWTNASGILVQLPEKIVNASGDYGYTKTMPLDLSTEWQEKPTEDQLRERAKKYIADNNIGVPNVSWRVEFVQLEQTEEYKGMALLERVLLGDTVSVEFAEMGISASARVVETRYKPILERYESVTLGKVKSNIASTIVNQQQQINGKPNQTQMQMAINTLTAIILGAFGGAVRLLDTNGDGMPDELYIADNADPALAAKVWRFNYEGWAASKNGYNGPFVMGATLDGGIVADIITTGTLNASLLKAGVIASADGSVQIDLTNNKISINVQLGDSAKRKIEFASNGLHGFGEDTDTGELYDTLMIMPAILGSKAIRENSISSSYGTDMVVTASATALPDGTIIPPGCVRIGSSGMYAPPVKIKGKTVDWKDNGDGTCTLIGT